MAPITGLTEGPNRMLILLINLIVEEELYESSFFLELLVEFNKQKREQIASIYKEGEDLLKIIVASLKSLRK
ncbi:MAG: hypothetical protein ABIR03_10690 [Ginsengibacter sp.]